METKIKLKKEIKVIAEWPTNTISINFYNELKNKFNSSEVLNPKRIILFIPGNPGCIEWYGETFLFEIVKQLGTDYAAYGVSYAGHGVGENLHVGKNEKDAFGVKNQDQNTGKEKITYSKNLIRTVQGQVRHKIKWIDDVLASLQKSGKNNQYSILFLTHSIGAYLVQCLCVERPDILARTRLIFHLMPFFRFHPEHYFSDQLPLQAIASTPYSSVQLVAFLSFLISFIPKNLLAKMISKASTNFGEDLQARDVVEKIIIQPEFGRNFLSLGINEFLLVPKTNDDEAMAIICQKTPTLLLYCNEDKWASRFHINDIFESQLKKKFGHVYFNYMHDISHDFIVHPKSKVKVTSFVVDSILKHETLYQKCFYDHDETLLHDLRKSSRL